MKRKLLPLSALLYFLIACSPNSAKFENEELTAIEVGREFIHEKYDFTEKNIEERITGLSDQALDDPAGFLTLAAKMLGMGPEYLLLVDKNHALHPDFQPAVLVDLASYREIIRGRDGLMLDERAADELEKLSVAAAADGIILKVSSAYRSFEYQAGLFNRYAERDGEVAAARYSARAGMSQHQLGTTVDFGDITNEFAGSSAGLWMSEHAGDFGWSLSYPQTLEAETGYSWESWHWRWIGSDAVKMQNQYFNGIQQRMLMFWNENASLLREALIL